MCKKEPVWKKYCDSLNKEMLKDIHEASYNFDVIKLLTFKNGWKFKINSLGANRFYLEIIAEENRKDIPYPMSLEEFAPELLEKWIMEKAKLDEKILTEIAVKIKKIKRWKQKDIDEYKIRKQEEENHIR